MKTIIFSLLLSVLFASCSSFSGHLTRRYRSIEVIEDDSIIKERVDVHAYTIEKDGSYAPKTIFDLSPDAQAALISELAKKEVKTDAFISGLTRDFSSKLSDTTGIMDYSLLETRIVVSIRNKSHQPADRIAKINITLTIDTTKNNSITFLSCNKLTTEYQTLDLGKLHYSNTQSGELAGKSFIAANREGATTIKGEGAGEAKLSANRSFSEEILLKQRMVASNAFITQNTLSLYQESIGGIDLTGNILADITLEIRNSLLNTEKTYSFSELSTQDVSNIKVSEKLIVYPTVENLKVYITFEADFREVSKKHQTISESDDKVKLYHGEVKDANNVVILPIIKPKLWTLTFSELPLRIRNIHTNEEGDLLFHSHDDAKKMVAWLKSKYNEKMNEKIVVGSKYEISISEFEKSMNIECLTVAIYKN